MISIRAYQNRDWGEVCRIHDRARPDELAGSCDPRAFVPLASDPEAKELPEYALLVACRGNAVVGFTGTRSDYIGWLYVDPDYYGRGIGRKLLREAARQAGPAAWTICLKENKRALHLYHSEGFRQVEEFQSENAGYPCTCLRLALPTDR